LGVFGVAASQQAYPGSSQRVSTGLLLPLLMYRGPVLRADENSLGLRALRTPRLELDIGLSGAFGSHASESVARRGMADIGTLVEFGPRLRLDLGPAPGDGRWRLSLPLRGVFDLSHQLASRGLSFEPELSWRRRSSTGWSTTVHASAVIANERLADVFYEVGPRDVTTARPAYDAKAGLIAWRLSLSTSTHLSPDWRLFGYGRLDSVQGAANRHSPLVDRNSGASVGIGLAWTGLRSQARAAD
jgi:hypothetical protein